MWIMLDKQPFSNVTLVNVLQQITWHHAQNVVSLTVLYKVFIFIRPMLFVSNLFLLTLLFDHFQCHCTVNRQRLFILEMWIVQLPEILKACPYKLECAYFAYIGVYFRILDNDTYDKVVRLPPHYACNGCLSNIIHIFLWN
jgi:hypothetical protein